MKTVLITGACINTGVAIVEKFASENYNVIFTGRNKEKVLQAEAQYKEKFPNVEIIGYTIDSLIDERTIDEKSAKEMFDFIDNKGIFVERKQEGVRIEHNAQLQREVFCLRSRLLRR